MLEKALSVARYVAASAKYTPDEGWTKRQVEDLERRLADAKAKNPSWLKVKSFRIIRNSRGRAVALQTKIARARRNPTDLDLYITQSGPRKFWVMGRTGSIHRKPFGTLRAAEKVKQQAEATGYTGWGYFKPRKKR